MLPAMRLVFLGSGEFGLPTLEALVREHDVAAVISQPDKPAGRKRLMTPTPIAAWAEAHAIPVLKSEDVNTPEFVRQVADLRPEAAVVIAFGQKLSPELIGSLGRLGVNLHSSLLPKYRGAAPINWAMIRGDAVTGVSVIGLAQRMDAGEVYATAQLEISPLETAGELHDRLAALGPGAVLRVLSDLQRDALTPIPQDHAQATKAPKLSKDDGTVDFALPAAKVRARVHGLTPWPGCRVIWKRKGGESLTLTLARVRDYDEAVGGTPGTFADGFRVACGEGAVELLEVQAPGTRVMPVAEFARGRTIAAGDVLEPMPRGADQ